jgi:dTDP-4-amino-4,6-dideoxygalactose transaminase
MRAVLTIVRERNLLVVEDCAQAWCEMTWRGNEEADASLFSFGAIKTATAFGGSLCRVKDPAILARMREIQAREPVQAAGNFPFKFCKFAFLKAISGKKLFGWIAATARRMGKSVDEILGALTRGFSDDSLLYQLRQQPSAGVLTLLAHRLRTYDSQRIRRRMQHARRIITRLRLQESQPELLDAQHSFWLFPFMTEHADDLIRFLWLHGFDTTQRGRMHVVPAPHDRPDLTCPSATQLLARTVFLPCYAEVADDAIDHMCDLILSFRASGASARPAIAGRLPGNRAGDCKAVAGVDQ